MAENDRSISFSLFVTITAMGLTQDLLRTNSFSDVNEVAIFKILLVIAVHSRVFAGVKCIIPLSLHSCLTPEALLPSISIFTSASRRRDRSSGGPLRPNCASKMRVTIHRDWF